MKGRTFIGICLGVAVLCFILVVTMASGAEDTGDFTNYRVISEMPVELGQIMDMFIPGLSGGAKFLPPKANGIGLIHRWNPHLAGATWKTKLQPGSVIYLPSEWVPRGIQNVLEPVEEIPLLLPSGATQPMGSQFWSLIMISFAIGFMLYLGGFGKVLHRWRHGV